MPSFKDKTVIVLTSGVLATGLVSTLAPKPSTSVDELQRQRTQRDIQDLSDAHEEQLRQQRGAGKNAHRKMQTPDGSFAVRR